MASRHLIQIISKVQKRQGMIKKYNQPCVQRPPDRPQNSSHYTQVSVFGMWSLAQVWLYH